MNVRVAKWLLVAAGLTLAACESVFTMELEKSALSNELRNETAPVTLLPQGCPTLTTSLPAGKTSVTVSYQEPTTNQKGAPLKDLAYTTIYLSSPKGPAQAIRVWTNDSQGGALVTIRDIAAPTQEIGVCVTATNRDRKESGPISLTSPAR